MHLYIYKFYISYTIIYVIIGCLEKVLFSEEHFERYVLEKLSQYGRIMQWAHELLRDDYYCHFKYE